MSECETKCACHGCMLARKLEGGKLAKAVLGGLRALDRDFLSGMLKDMERAMEHPGMPALLVEGLQCQHTDFTVLLQAANAVHERCLDAEQCQELGKRMNAGMSSMQEGGNQP